MRDGAESGALECIADALCAVAQRQVAHDARVLDGLTDGEKTIWEWPFAGQRDALGACAPVATRGSAEPGDVPTIGTQYPRGAHEECRLPGDRSGRDAHHLACRNVEVHIAEDRDGG